MEYLHNGLVQSALKKESTTATCNNHEFQKHDVKGKQPYTKGYLLCDSIPINFKNRQNQFMVNEIRKVRVGKGTDWEGQGGKPLRVMEMF